MVYFVISFIVGIIHDFLIHFHNRVIRWGFLLYLVWYFSSVMFACTAAWRNRVGNTKSPIPLFSMFTYTWHGPFALPEFVSNLYFDTYPSFTYQIRNWCCTNKSIDNFEWYLGEAKSLSLVYIHMEIKGMGLRMLLILVRRQEDLLDGLHDIRGEGIFWQTNVQIAPAIQILPSYV